MPFAFYAMLLSSALLVPQAAVASSQSPQVTVAAVDPKEPRANTAIGPLDRLEVSVFREPELSAVDVPVDESGRVVLPLVGGLSAAGKTTEALAEEIEGKLRHYLRDPKVSVLVKQAASKRITVAGAVTEPGVFPVEGRTTLLQAVSLAKGPSQVARLDQALIFRTQNGKSTAARFNLGAIAKGDAPDPEVLPGDTVAIGSSRMKTAWRDVMMTMRTFNIFSIIP